MKKSILFLFVILLMASCSYTDKNYFKPNGKKYPFVVVVRNIEIDKDKNWYSSGDTKTQAMVACDSFQMVTPSECDVWIEGKKMNIKSNLNITPASTYK